MQLCHWCFREIGTAVKHKRRGWVILTIHSDHASPYSFSRSNAKSNLVTSCNLCNQWKGSRVFDSDDDCRRYLELKWSLRTDEQLAVLPQQFSSETIPEIEMPSEVSPQAQPKVQEIRKELYRHRKGRVMRYSLKNPDIQRSDKLVDRKGNAFMVNRYIPETCSKARRIGKDMYAQPIKPPHPDAKAIIRKGQIWWIW